jgi:hypothetical protein
VLGNSMLAHETNTSMQPRVVRTKEELKAAVEGGADRIIVRGDLAQQFNTALKVKSASKAVGCMILVSATSS